MYEPLKHYIRRTVAISETDLEYCCRFFQEEHAVRGSNLLSQGQHSQRTYFVLKGCLRLFYLNSDGQESTRYLAFENQMATALVSFISGKPTQETLQALEDSHLLYIHHDDFQKLRDEIPAWDAFYCRYVEKAYVNTVSHLFTFTHLDAMERYQLLLKKNPEIVRRLPNKIVASYLHISQETLSRLKARAFK